MVRAAVPEWELERPVARREPEELVPETDAEHGRPSEEVADRLDLAFERLGISGAVREHDSVEGRKLVGSRRVREDRHAGTCTREPAQDRALRAVVDDRDARPVRLVEDVRLRRGDLRDERLSFHQRLLAHLLERCISREELLVRDHCPHRAAVAQAQHERARVDLLEREEVVRAEASPPTPRPPSRRMITAFACGPADSSRSSETP